MSLDQRRGSYHARHADHADAESLAGAKRLVPVRHSTSRDATVRLFQVLLICAIACLTLAAAGCSRAIFGSDSELSIVSRDQPGGDSVGASGGGASGGELRVTNPFTTVLYRYESSNRVTVLMMQGRPENPQRVAMVRMFWKPVAGATPIDRSATNAVVRLFDFRDTPTEPDAVGLYAGGGFMRLHDDPRLNQITASLREADLRLTDRSEDYVDRLGRTQITGSFTAKRDDARVTVLLRELDARLSERLEYPRLVLGNGIPRDVLAMND